MYMYLFLALIGSFVAGFFGRFLGSEVSTIMTTMLELESSKLIFKYIFLILILVLVSRILVRVLWYLNYKRIVHGTTMTIEFLWTFTIEFMWNFLPSIILMVIIPSFALLYSTTDLLYSIIDKVVVDPAIYYDAMTMSPKNDLESGNELWDAKKDFFPDAGPSNYVPPEQIFSDDNSVSAETSLGKRKLSTLSQDQLDNLKQERSKNKLAKFAIPKESIDKFNNLIQKKIAPTKPISEFYYNDTWTEEDVRYYIRCECMSIYESIGAPFGKIHHASWSSFIYQHLSKHAPLDVCKMIFLDLKEKGPDSTFFRTIFNLIQKKKENE